MMRFWPSLGFSRALLAATCLFSCGGFAAAGPNVVLVMTDDQGFGDLGFHGNRVLKTPHLDAMAERSARLPNFLVSPVCTPTRASLMTGRYNYRTRAIDTFKGRALMDTAEVTVAEMLREHGYGTGLFGKWHLGDNFPLRPQDQGFDEVLRHLGGGLAQPSDPPENERRYTDAILFHNGEKVKTKGYCTDVYFDAAIEWIEERHAEEEPFFAYIATNAPHAPWHDVPEEWYAYYKEQEISVASLGLEEGYPNHEERKVDADTLARYYAMISNIDDNMGKLVEALEGMGVLEDTLLIFMTDNGPAPNGFSAGLRGKKAMPYEGGVRSPFFVHWPARLEAGERSARIGAHIDVLPTILEATGATAPEEVVIDGRSLLPLLEDPEEADESWPERAIVLQSHRGNAPAAEHNFCVRTDRWKLVRASGFRFEEPPTKGEGFELFDLDDDPYEKKDVAAEHPEIVTRLKARYGEWFSDVSGTRKNNYAAPWIRIGSPKENPTVLSKQDRREANGENKMGHWKLAVARAGDFEVVVTVAEGPEAGTLQVRIGDDTGRADWPATAPLSFALPKGPLKLEAWIEDGEGAKHGVDFVTIRRGR